MPYKYCQVIALVNPSKESLDILQQKHSQAPLDLALPPSPSATTPPTYFSQNQIQATISSFPHGSGAGPEGLRPQHLKDCISISAGDATSLLTSLTELVNHLSNGHLPTALPPFLYGAQLQRTVQKQWRPETYRCRVHLLTPGCKGLLETLHLKAVRVTPTLPAWGKHPPGLRCRCSCHTLFHGTNAR